jgi:antitoxin HigA-1
MSTWRTIIKETAMEMKAPPHPGELVGDIFDELGITQQAAAEALGVTRQAVSAIVNSKAAISPKMAFRLELANIGSAAVLLRMQAAYDLSKVRKHKPRVGNLVA